MKTVKEIDISRQLKAFFKGSIEINKPLCDCTSIKIGGAAALFLEPESDIDLARAVKFFSSAEIPFRVIGNGTNLLIDDQRLEMAVIKLSSLFFREISVAEDALYMRGGVNLAHLLNFSIKNGVCGFEFLAGIPGSAGGALIMNAGIRNPFQSSIADGPYLSISDSLIKIEVMDAQGKIFELNKNDCGFVYRGSKLKELIILGAYFKIKNKSSKQISDRIKIILRKRRVLQEMCVRSAGCVFKNPTDENISAGELIENAKLKGRRIGKAQVSGMHANFIVNLGNATFSEVRKLMNIVQEKVKQDSGITLEPEVEIWDKREL